MIANILLLFVSQAVADQTTCGDVKAIYQDQSCCHATTETATNIQTIVAKDTSMLLQNFVATQIFTDMVATNTDTLPDFMNPCLAPGFKLTNLNAKNGSATLMCKSPSSGMVVAMVSDSAEAPPSLAMVKYTEVSGEIGTLKFMYGHNTPKDLVPGVTYEWKSSEFNVSVPNQNVIMKEDMYYGVSPNPSSALLMYGKDGALKLPSKGYNVSETFIDNVTNATSLATLLATPFNTMFPSIANFFMGTITSYTLEQLEGLAMESFQPNDQYGMMTVVAPPMIVPYMSYNGNWTIPPSEME
jgi:hypothetical protein